MAVNGDADADTATVRKPNGCGGEFGDGFDAEFAVGVVAGVAGPGEAVSKARDSARGFHWCHTSSRKNLEHAT